MSPNSAARKWSRYVSTVMNTELAVGSLTLKLNAVAGIVACVCRT
jgi:hypothetical protein